MSLRLTPEVLSAAYEFLRVTSPFKGWKLPDSGDVSFKVSQAVGEHGEYQMTNSGHDIVTLSAQTLGHTANVMLVMAHEMVHMHMAHNGTLNHKDLHCAVFQRHARTVCRHHGFDAKVFV